MQAPEKLAATDAAAAIANGKLTSEALVAACLERVRERENEVQAWAYIDPDAALREARARDQQTPKTRLHGIPVAVKDVIDTFDMPTEYGSPIYRGNQPGCDAACVAQTREAGGVILGKTVSTEFATRHPGKTRNPRHPGHTPGGSSSGSAAASADFMVPIAFGTQTSSSIIRPAAFCGAVGYKPTFNMINRAGLKFLSDSFDTIGVLTRTVPDAALIVATLAGAAPTDFAPVDRIKPRVGFCRTPYWEHADAPTHRALEDAARRLAAAGAQLAEVELQGEFASLADIQIAVSSFEFYRALTYERSHFPQLISKQLMGRIEAGGRVTRDEYLAGLALIARCRRQLDDVFRDYDVLLAPSAPGEAPKGLAATGDPIFGLMWTVLHGPSLTLPVFTGPSGLPLGAQVIGNRGTDARTLQCAEWVMRVLT